MSNIEAKLQSMGHALPEPPAALGSYVPWVRVGNLLYLSGTICALKGEMTHTGKVGAAHDIAAAQQAAQICALNALAAIKAAAGSLEAIERIVQLNGFVNAIEGFSDSPAVINGASDLLVGVLGEAGKHSRAAVVVSGLPKDSTVELQILAQLKN